MNEEAYNELTSAVIGAAIEVHRQLGPGLLEAVYEECLISELKNKGLKVENQVKLPIIYKGKELSKHFIIDIVVEDKLIVELKAVEDILSVHEVQLVTYLKLSGMKLGLLINFNETVLKNGIRRRINS
ncbi:GxxExxY protein [Carboxylicivirga mesophila]|uniref:GxxExxY protein n=1 Tax=Carboxylicivirga mesophila TaxID=1166478 RepID=A0ABS5KF37_9BACT|nr:GxxExxY protein [Carboxylicivirga mesophila]MBS2213673.1 GxxExxY protein [Carboxylicivirga mesophila]